MQSEESCPWSKWDLLEPLAQSVWWRKIKTATDLLATAEWVKLYVIQETVDDQHGSFVHIWQCRDRAVPNLVDDFLALRTRFTSGTISECHAHEGNVILTICKLIPIARDPTVEISNSSSDCYQREKCILF